MAKESAGSSPLTSASTSGATTTGKSNSGYSGYGDKATDSADKANADKAAIDTPSTFQSTDGDETGGGRSTKDVEESRVIDPDAKLDYPADIPDTGATGNLYPPSKASLEAEAARAEVEADAAEEVAENAREAAEAARKGADDYEGDK